MYACQSTVFTSEGQRLSEVTWGKTSKPWKLLVNMISQDRNYRQFSCMSKSVKMDSEVQREGRLLDIVDDEWRKEKLPNDDIQVPIEEVPELDNGNDDRESLKDQDKKWTDVAIQNISQEVNGTQRT
ncbi:Anaphase-promoting complex subunit 13 [Holothuria leucospilota]|uniref:Anaphase-promoting complex subunit 13 n=1 Tax=Holothuria leucospilota TaxID=206669 RepID=A0A9Q1BX83_HOLLE|nr:Anaphase-promoting complex subunit 13 [Holothuria leucospilota]